MITEQQVIWRSTEGKVIACVKNNKVLDELIAQLKNPYPPRE